MYSNMTRRKRKSKSSSSSGNNRSSSSSSGYKQYKGDKRQDEPFWITNLKVGGTLSILCVAIYSLYNVGSLMGWESQSGSVNSEGVWSKYVDDESGPIDLNEAENKVDDSKIRVFPEFELTKASSYDVWGIQDTFFSDTRTTKKNKYDDFLQQVNRVKDDFATVWGGVNSARKVLEMGLITFEPKDTTADMAEAAADIDASHEKAADADANVNTNTDADADAQRKLKSSQELGKDIPHGIRNTARRIVEAHQNKKPFKISFAGGAAVTGRGNYYEDSFPTVLFTVITDAFQKLGVEVEVRNGAVAGISSFPYGWCLKNFLGDDADVISWDPELTNRGDSNAAFEAYLRNAITMKQSPMVILREYVYTEKRREMMQKYVDLGAISDPVVVNVAAAVDAFKNFDESIFPPEYTNWDKFSAPDGAPGMTRTNLSLKQHELVGEMLGMYFLAAAEIAAAHLLKLLPNDFLDVGPASKPGFKHYLLPPPQSAELENDGISKNTTIMFGNKVPADHHWYMNDVYCRTSFDPVIDGRLNDTIISGTDAESLDLFLPRGPMLYNKNWVMGYGSSARTEANNLKQYNLGYKDRRKGYFGVQPSGNLTLFLPYQLDNTITTYEQLKERKPSDVFKSVIVCEVNERANCKMEKDVSFRLDGVPSDAKTMKANGVSYNGRKICVSMKVPTGASWSTRKISEKKGGLLRKKRIEEETGLILDISVKNNLVFWKDGPCSISHVIWEQKRTIQ